jgi:hypothetical protein
MKFEKHSKYDKIWIGLVSGLIIATLVTLIVILANAKDYTIAEHFKYLFNDDEFGALLRSRVLLSLKGGALGIMPLFYLFLNKKMYRSVKGVIIVAAFIFLIIVAGAVYN